MMAKEQQLRYNPRWPAYQYAKMLAAVAGAATPEEVPLIIPDVLPEPANLKRMLGYE